MNRIKQLKEEKNAVILAHYYVDADVQAAADFIGDSFYLAKKAAETVIVTAFAALLVKGQVKSHG